jgi:hypothetical protein
MTNPFSKRDFRRSAWKASQTGDPLFTFIFILIVAAVLLSIFEH